MSFGSKSDMAELPAALILSTSWNKEHGSHADPSTGKLISEFCRNTFKSSELLKIHCTVLDVEVTEEQQHDALQFRVTLIPATRNKWAEKLEEPQVSWLIYHDIHYPKLRNLIDIKYVIGFAPKTKNAASAIHEKLFPEAELHFIPSPDQHAAVLFVYDAWNKDDCGLTGFQRIIVQEFCERKVKAGEPVKAYSTVLDVTISDTQKRDAGLCGVTLITAQRKEGIKAKDDPCKLEWLLNHESYYPDLNKLDSIQHVVGYAPKTGYAAADIQRKLFRDAKLVLINHACPHNNCLEATMTGLLEFEEKMLEMACKADLLFSIGPTVYEYFHNAYRADFQGKPLSLIPHQEILPKVMPDFAEKYPVQRMTIPTSNILTCGQLDTQEAIEPCRVIAASIGNFVQQLQTAPPTWKILGVSTKVDTAVLVKRLKTNQVHLTLQPGFSADKLMRSIQQSHLCIPAPVYMDYGFIGLEAAVFGLPTVFNDCSELANFIKSHFEEHEADWIAEEGLPKKILQHLKDPSKAFKKAKRLKADLLQSEVVSGSYAKFASLLSAPLQQQVVYGPKLPAGARDVTETKSDITELQDDQSLSKSQPIHGPEKKEKELGDTTQLQKMGKGEKNETSATTKSEMRHEDKKMLDCLTMLLKLDDNERNKCLEHLKKKYKASSELQPLEAEEKNTVDSAWTVCEQGLKRRIEKVLHDEHDCEEVKRVCKKNLGEVHPYSFSNESLAILLRFLTHYNLCRLKQTCRSGHLAKAFEPLLITDEMREIAAKVGITLQLKATYDQEKFAEVELFFINRDGGGIKPLKSYNNVIDEMYIEDDDHDCNTEDGNQQVDDTSVNDAMQSEVPSKMLVLEIDLKLEMKPSTETNVRSLLNPVRLTKQKGKQYDILLVVMAMTDRIQHILTSRLEILALLGFVRYMLTDVADGDERQNIPELEEQLFLNGNPIPPITSACDTQSLQARSLLLFQISKRQQTDSVIRYLALARSTAQSVHNQPDIEKSKLLAAKKILENQLTEGKQEKSHLEKRCKELLQEKEKYEKAITTQHSDIQILKDKLEKLNLKYLQSKLEQKDKPISELMTKSSDAQSYVELQNTESLELKEEFIDAEPQREGQSIFEDIGKPPESPEIREMQATSHGTLGQMESRADKKQQPESTVLRHKESLAIQTTSTEIPRPVSEEQTMLKEHGAASTERKQIKGKKSGVLGKIFVRLSGRKDTAVSKKIKISGGWSKFTLKGQGPSPGQKFNNPLGFAFQNDLLLVCDSLNNIVQILNQDYTCVRVLGSFSGQFTKPFQPVSIAVSQDNHYFILDYSNLLIVVCDQNNKVVSIITLPADSDPRCIALSKGFVLVTDIKGHRLLKYTKTGQYVAEVGCLGLGQTQFHYPRFVAVNSRDIIMVSDCDNHCIKCFDADFNYMYQYGQYGTGDGQLYYPRSIAVDGADNVYICDDNNRISMWSSDGTWRYNLLQSEVSRPLNMAVSQNRICVRGLDDQHITVFSK